MIKNLRSISYILILCSNYVKATEIDLNNLVQVITGTPASTQPQNSVLNPSSPSNGVVSTLIQQTSSNTLESPTSKLPKGGKLSVFRNGDWQNLSENDYFTDINVALLVHDLTQDKSHLRNLASTLSNIPKNLSAYNDSSSIDTSNGKSYFQLVFALEYPSMKTFKNKNEKEELISSVCEEIAPRIMLGAKNAKSLTIFAHGLGGLIIRYALEKQFPTLKEFSESDYKDIYKKIKLITLGTPHSGIPKQIAETAYKNCVETNISNVVTSNVSQQASNYLEQQKNNLLGQQVGGIISLLAPGVLSSPISLGESLNQQNIYNALPVIKEIESDSEFLRSLNKNTFVYADQTNYFTIAGTKSTEFQIGLGDKQTEVGTTVQSIYASKDSTIRSDGLVSQYSANAKEIGNVCINWIKDYNNRNYTLSLNHAELIGNQSNQSFIQQVVPVFIKILSLSKEIMDSSTATSVNNLSNTSLNNVAQPDLSINKK